jgi:hypothetical protein
VHNVRSRSKINKPNFPQRKGNATSRGNVEFTTTSAEPPIAPKSRQLHDRHTKGGLAIKHVGVPDTTGEQQAQPIFLQYEELLLGKATTGSPFKHLEPEQQLEMTSFFEHMEVNIVNDSADTYGAYLEDKFGLTRTEGNPLLKIDICAPSSDVPITTFLCENPEQRASLSASITRNKVFLAVIGGNDSLRLKFFNGTLKKSDLSESQVSRLEQGGIRTTSKGTYGMQNVWTDSVLKEAFIKHAETSFCQASSDHIETVNTRREALVSTLDTQESSIEEQTDRLAMLKDEYVQASITRQRDLSSARTKELALLSRKQELASDEIASQIAGFTAEQQDCLTAITSHNDDVLALNVKYEEDIEVLQTSLSILDEDQHTTSVSFIAQKKELDQAAELLDVQHQALGEEQESLLNLISQLDQLTEQANVSNELKHVASQIIEQELRETILPKQLSVFISTGKGFAATQKAIWDASEQTIANKLEALYAKYDTKNMAAISQIKGLCAKITSAKATYSEHVSTFNSALAAHNEKTEEFQDARQRKLDDFASRRLEITSGTKKLNATFSDEARDLRAKQKIIQAETDRLLFGVETISGTRESFLSSVSSLNLEIDAFMDTHSKGIEDQNTSMTKLEESITELESEIEGLVADYNQTVTTFNHEVAVAKKEASQIERHNTKTRVKAVRSHNALGVMRSLSDIRHDLSWEPVSVDFLTSSAGSGSDPYVTKQYDHLELVFAPPIPKRLPKITHMGGFEPIDPITPPSLEGLSAVLGKPIDLDALTNPSEPVMLHPSEPALVSVEALEREISPLTVGIRDLEPVNQASYEFEIPFITRENLADARSKLIGARKKIPREKRGPINSRIARLDTALSSSDTVDRAHRSEKSFRSFLGAISISGQAPLTTAGWETDGNQFLLTYDHTISRGGTIAGNTELSSQARTELEHLETTLFAGTGSEVKKGEKPMTKTIDEQQRLKLVRSLRLAQRLGQ